MSGWAALRADASGHMTATAADGTREVRFDSEGVIRHSGAAVTATTFEHDPESGRRFIADDHGIACVQGEADCWRHPEPATALCLAADRRRLYAAAGERVMEYDTASGDGRLLATIKGATLVALALAPGGLVGLDAAQAGLHGINVRHGTTTKIFTGHWANPAAVAYQRVGDTYVIADAGDPELWLVSRDGSTARRLALRYA